MIVGCVTQGLFLESTQPKNMMLLVLILMVGAIAKYTPKINQWHKILHHIVSYISARPLSSVREVPLNMMVMAP